MVTKSIDLNKLWIQVKRDSILKCLPQPTAKMLGKTCQEISVITLLTSKDVSNHLQELHMKGLIKRCKGDRWRLTLKAIKDGGRLWSI